MSDDSGDLSELSPDELEALLSEALTPVTSAHHATAQAAFAWRDVDAALASLVETHQVEPLLRSTAAASGNAQRLSYAVTFTGADGRSARTGTVVIDVEQVSASTLNAVALVDAALGLTACAIRHDDGGHRKADVVDSMAILDGITVGIVARFEFEIDGVVVAAAPWMTL